MLGHRLSRRLAPPSRPSALRRYCPPDMLGHLGYCLGLQQAPHGQLDADQLLDPSNNLDCLERVAAECEEVVGRRNPLALEHLRPHGANLREQPPVSCATGPGARMRASSWRGTPASSLPWARLGDYGQARAHLAESLRLCRELQDRAGEAHVHQILCGVADHQGRRAEVLSHGRQALALFRAVGNRFGQAEALNNVGWAHLLLGRPWQALQFCQKAVAMNRELENRYGEAASWDSFGTAESQLGRHDHAAESYRRAVTIVRELGDRYTEAEILTNFGDACLAAGQPHRARNAWHQALTIFDQLCRPEADQVRAKLADRPPHFATAGRRT
jgi:Tfp pilus assembly protein PilF